MVGVPIGLSLVCWCCPFDDARNKKVGKYSKLAKDLSINNKNHVVEALVTGALCSWDQMNSNAFRRICARSYIKRMKWTIVSKIIAYSNNIFQEHIGRVPQDSNVFQGWGPFPQSSCFVFSVIYFLLYLYIVFSCFKYSFML